MCGTRSVRRLLDLVRFLLGGRGRGTGVPAPKRELRGSHSVRPSATSSTRTRTNSRGPLHRFGWRLGSGGWRTGTRSRGHDFKLEGGPGPRRGTGAAARERDEGVAEIVTQVT
eukprot:2549314-Rhodomonas_salina.1